jgi:glycerophosphoryl diester phosphodiesterase
MLGLPPAPWIFGHRGCRDKLAENTLGAIEAAAKAGVVGVEIDVRLCATGELVVVHDESLERVTAGRDTRRIADLDLSELQSVTLEPAAKVPTLQEVLDLCEQRDLVLNVELKRDVPSRLAVVRQAVAILRRRPRVFVSSFDPLMLAALRFYDGRIPIGLLLQDEGPRPPVGLLSKALQALSIHVDPPLASDANIERWHDAGLRVLVWTVNDPAEAGELIARGVDGIMTDVPAKLALI